jgi:hypothetical protein
MSTHAEGISSWASLLANSELSPSDLELALKQAMELRRNKERQERELEKDFCHKPSASKREYFICFL